MVQHILCRPLRALTRSGTTTAASTARAGERYAGWKVARFRKMLISAAPTVIQLQRPSIGSHLWIIGTSHGTEASSKLVNDVLTDVHPDVTMLELCADRLCRFLNTGSDEMIAAVRHKHCGQLALIDLPRAREQFTSYACTIPLDRLTAELLAEQPVNSFRSKFRFEHPALHTPMISQFVVDYRDRVMVMPLARQLSQPRSRAVAVVGKSHVQGLVRLLTHGTMEANASPPTVPDACHKDSLHKVAVIDALMFDSPMTQLLPRCNHTISVAASWPCPTVPFALTGAKRPSTSSSL